MRLPVCRQVARHAPLEFGGEVRMRRGVFFEQAVPLRLALRTFATRIPAGVDFGRDFEWRIRPVSVQREQVVQRCG